LNFSSLARGERKGSFNLGKKRKKRTGLGKEKVMGSSLVVRGRSFTLREEEKVESRGGGKR